MIILVLKYVIKTQVGALTHVHVPFAHIYLFEHRSNFIHDSLLTQKLFNWNAPSDKRSNRSLAVTNALICVDRV